jgi:tetratricopeptide (TPR) repeat protein
MKTRDAFIKQKLEARKHVLSEGAKPKPKDMKWMVHKIDRENEKRRASSARVDDNLTNDQNLSTDSREDSVDSLFHFGEKRMQSQSSSFDKGQFCKLNEMNDSTTTRIPPVRPYTIATILSKEEQKGDKRIELKLAYRNATVEELLRYGDSYFNTESYDAAKTRYAAAIHKANQSGFVDERIADAHVKLAMINSRGEDINEIILHFTCAQEIYEKLYMELKAKKEDVRHLGKKIIEVTTSIANSYANANDIEGALLAHKHVINRTERCFPHDVSLNVKAVNAYAYTLSFTANDHEKALRMLNYIISQYSQDNLDKEVLESLVIKGKILLSQCRSANEHEIKEKCAKEAEDCFMKVIQIHKMHPAKYSSNQMATLVALSRNVREIQRDIEIEKVAIAAESNQDKEISENNVKVFDMENHDTDGDSVYSYRYNKKDKGRKYKNRTDSESICTIDAEASNGMALCQDMDVIDCIGCNWFFDVRRS